MAVTDHGMPGSLWAGLLPRLYDLFLTVSAYSARELLAPPDQRRRIDHIRAKVAQCQTMDWA